MIRLILIAEFPNADSVGEAQHQLDEMRERALPSLAYGVTLVRPELPDGPIDGQMTVKDFLYIVRELDPYAAPIYTQVVQGSEHHSVDLVGIDNWEEDAKDPAGPVLKVSIVDTEAEDDDNPIMVLTPVKPEEYVYRYTSEDEPLLRCPNCHAYLTEPNAIELTLSIDGRTVDTPSRLSAAGYLIDTHDHAVVNGYHSETSCANCCQSLTIYEEQLRT